MPNGDTAGPEGAAKAIGQSKKLMESWKQGPMGTKTGHLGAVSPDLAPKAAQSASYSMVPKAKKEQGHEPIGGATAEAINIRRQQQAEAGKIAKEQGIPSPY